MAFQKKTTAHVPKATTVVVSQETLVVTLHEALSPGELTVAKSPSGALKVQEFRRQLFINSSQPLRDEIKRITGAEVWEAVAEVGPSTGAVVQAFTSIAGVQVYRLAENVAGSSWSSSEKRQ